VPGGGCVMADGSCPGPLIPNQAGNSVCPEASLAAANSQPCPPGVYPTGTTKCETDGSGAPICASGVTFDNGNGNTTCEVPPKPKNCGNNAVATVSGCESVGPNCPTGTNGNSGQCLPASQASYQDCVASAKWQEQTDGEFESIWRDGRCDTGDTYLDSATWWGAG
jgi:hypothetical protein